jgi:hypothetical protein
LGHQLNKEIKQPIWGSSYAQRNLEWVLLFKMELDKVKEMNNAMKEMADKYGYLYFELFGRKVLEGMDIETAVWYCYNKLNTKK